MNSISWLIYLADIAGRVGTFFGITGTLSIMGGVVITLIGKNSWHYLSYVTDESKAEYEKFRKWLGSNGPRFVITGFVFVMIATIIPKTNTIYLIASSEIGESILTNPNTVEIFTDLQSVVKKRLQQELADD